MRTVAPAHPQRRASIDAELLARLRSIALRGLARMYRRDEQLFVFCVRRGAHGDAPEGLSRRYTAMTLIGLAGEPAAAAVEVLHGDTPVAVCHRLLGDVERDQDLGDVALTLWAAQELGIAHRAPAYRRLCAFAPAERPHPTVELAWTLMALAQEDTASGAPDLAEAVARRLLSAFEPRCNVFPHGIGGRHGRLRGHVACFADLVYPIQALARYSMVSGDAAALEAAGRCARQACDLQGPAGQWWWHYDTRTGRVLEGYPVYSVHQDAMAPMALLALAEAGGEDHSAAIAAGLNWLVQIPELGGRSLIDDEAGLIWRKVARREPRKLVRRFQAATSALHPSVRLPGVDVLFPPVAVDWESRPYHLGWLLYAWSPARLAKWGYQTTPA